MRLLREKADLEPLNKHVNGIEDLLGGTCAYGIRLSKVMGSLKFKIQVMVSNSEIDRKYALAYALRKGVMS